MHFIKFLFCLGMYAIFGSGMRVCERPFHLFHVQAMYVAFFLGLTMYVLRSSDYAPDGSVSRLGIRDAAPTTLLWSDN